MERNERVNNTVKCVMNNTAQKGGCIMEKYEKPVMEVEELDEEIILSYVNTGISIDGDEDE